MRQGPRDPRRPKNPADPGSTRPRAFLARPGWLGLGLLALLATTHPTAGSSGGPTPAPTAPVACDLTAVLDPECPTPHVFFSCNVPCTLLAPTIPCGQFHECLAPDPARPPSFRSCTPTVDCLDPASTTFAEDPANDGGWVWCNGRTAPQAVDCREPAEGARGPSDLSIAWDGTTTGRVRSAATCEDFYACNVRDQNCQCWVYVGTWSAWNHEFKDGAPLSCKGLIGGKGVLTHLRGEIKSTTCNDESAGPSGWWDTGLLP